MRRRWILKKTGGHGLCVAMAVVLATALVGPPLAAQGSIQTFELSVKNGNLARSDNVIRVTKGDTVRLRWKSDKITVVHLHGYDIETTLNPGQTTELSFTAYATGRFPVSIHSADDRGSSHHHGGALVYIEVLPR